MQRTTGEFALWIKERINPVFCGILIHHRYGSVVGMAACREVRIEGSQEWGVRHSGVQNRRIEEIPIPMLGFLFPNQVGNASGDSWSTIKPFIGKRELGEGIVDAVFGRLWQTGGFGWEPCFWKPLSF